MDYYYGFCSLFQITVNPERRLLSFPPLTIGNNYKTAAAIAAMVLKFLLLIFLLKVINFETKIQLQILSSVLFSLAT